MADKTPAGTVFTQADLDAAIADARREEARAWQGRLTPIQQQNAHLQSQLAGSEELARRLDRMESMIQSQPRGTAEPEMPSIWQEDWSDIKDPNELRDKIRRTNELMAQQIAQGSARGREQAQDEYAQRIEQLEQDRYEAQLDEMVRKLRDKHRWMDDGHVRLVLQEAENAEVMDLDYITDRMLREGYLSPGEGIPGHEIASSIQPYPEVLTGPTGRPDESRRRSVAERGVSGRGTPETVSVRSGIGGYHDVERIANQFYEDQGR